MLQFCDVANKFKTLKNFQYLTGNMLKTPYIISLECQNPDRLITICGLVINFKFLI